MPRCFIGLPLPDAYQQGLDRLCGQLRLGLDSQVGFTRPGNWHLTLRFLGDVAEEAVDTITDTLSPVVFEPFTLQAGGGGFFPDARRPRVLWVGLRSGREQSAALAGAINAALVPLGFEPETRPFRAHLTIGRVKKPGRDDWRGVQMKLAKEKWPAITVDHFVLWQSVLRPQGPEYRVLAEFGPKS